MDEQIISVHFETLFQLLHLHYDKNGRDLFFLLLFFPPFKGPVWICGSAGTNPVTGQCCKCKLACKHVSDTAAHPKVTLALFALT